jgi:hypothetical protein
MALIKKIVVLRNLITDIPRNKSELSFYYPIDILLEIMKDLMSVLTESEDFNNEILDTAIFKIDIALEFKNEQNTDNLDINEYRDKAYGIMQTAAIRSYELFVNAVNKHRPTVAGQYIS